MKTHTTRRGAASTLKAAVALDPRAVTRALGRRVVSRHSIRVPGSGHSLHDAIALAKARPTTAQSSGTA